MFDSLYLREPLWLFALLIPLLIVFMVYYHQKKIWQEIADESLLPWLQVPSQSSRQILSQIFFALAWALLCLALAGPRSPQKIPPALQTDDVAVIAIIDFSQSMKAVDEKINRIVQAQNILKYWLEKFPTQLRMGLIIYSGYSHTLLIPTKDKDLLKHYVTQLHQFTPPTLGNNLAVSLQAAIGQLKDFKGKKQIVLFSDGDLGSKASDAAEGFIAHISADKILNLTVIGVGRSEAVRIPVGTYQSLTVEGKVIVSRRQTGWLKEITEQAGGTYHNAESLPDEKLEQVLGLAKPRIDPEFNHQILWNEYFFIPLSGGILLSLLALQISRKTPYKLTALSLIFFLSGCYSSHDKYFEYFSEGVNCYQMKDYACAQQSFASAAWSTENKERRGKAVFNLANTHFKLGDYEQASILFQDAASLGVPESKTRINQSFADSLAKSIRRHFADIARTMQRADWLSSAHKLPEDFDGRIAEGIYLQQMDKTKTILSGLMPSEQQLLIERGIKRIQSIDKTKTLSASGVWVSAKQGHVPQQTSGLFNRLMSIEAGLHYVPDEAIEIEGSRTW